MVMKATDQRWAEARARVYSAVKPLLKPTLVCPICSHRFSLLKRRLSEDLECPSCHSPLRIPIRFFVINFRITLAILAACIYLAYGRLNAFELIALLVGLFYLTSTAIVVVRAYLWPPRLESPDDSSSPLHIRRLGD